MKRVLIAGFVLACMAGTPAAAQTQTTEETMARFQEQMNTPSDPSLPPVESLTCDQLTAEMMVAGQQMNSQMDPNFAANVQEMQDEGERRRAGAMAGAVGAGLACAVPLPGMGFACAAAQRAQMAEQMSHVEEDAARRDRIVGAVGNSMQGIDIQRMQAINNRFESQHCPMPQAPQ